MKFSVQMKIDVPAKLPKELVIYRYDDEIRVSPVTEEEPDFSSSVEVLGRVELKNSRRFHLLIACILAHAEQYGTEAEDDEADLSLIIQDVFRCGQAHGRSKE